MVDDDTPEVPAQLPAGYTYVGQFIDHDLTLDITPLDRAHALQGRIRNFRTPLLDLDHVYAGGPNVSPFLYENDHKQRGRERFLIGNTIGAIPTDSSDNDLPRNAQGGALVGDPRQDENLIIAQLHVAFLKLHNRVLDGLEARPSDSLGPARGSRFAQARLLVTWVYHYVVLKDFLSSLIPADVLNDAIAKYEATDVDALEEFCIPIEFSAAAYRFGHSMVRDGYRISESQQSADLRTLLMQTGGWGGAVPALKEEWVIDWMPFFERGGGTQPMLSRLINPSLAPGLHHIHPETAALFSRPAAANCDGHEEEIAYVLPARTLVRGGRMGLPSGQDVARAYGVEPLSAAKMANGNHSEILTAHGFDTDTPLWYYVLKEAEHCGFDAARLPETVVSWQQLGPVGGRIVADTIVGAIYADPQSYVRVEPDWQPMIDGHLLDTAAAVIDFAHGVI